MARTTSAVAIPDKGLYPTIAISDIYNAVGHGAAAYIIHKTSPMSAAGFALVSFAATIGVLRFGFSERRFAEANALLAGLAAFCGLPLIGISALRHINHICPEFHSLPDVWLVCGLSAFYLLCVGTLPANIVEFLKIIVNVALFIVPVALVAHRASDHVLGLALLAFVIAGVVIKPEREQYLFGVRRENWFHYFIGTASFVIAQQLQLLL